MLYVTTRNNGDAFTSHKALTENSAQDGGCFYPYRFPCYSGEDLLALKDKSVGEIISKILNAFFVLKLNAWDVDCCIGRNILNTVSMQHRIVVAELWHNISGYKDFLTDSLYKISIARDGTDVTPTEWFKIAVKIAVLFAVYCDLLRTDSITPSESFDVSVAASDFSSPIAAYYARQMGLPINTIICTEINNSCYWDLLHRGTFNPLISKDYITDGTERLVHATLGYQYVNTYLNAVDNGQVFSLNDEITKQMNQGFFCSVIGDERLDTTINSVLSTNGYVVDPKTAMLFCGLQDFRAKIGESRTTLLIATENPLIYATRISAATGVSVDKIKKHI